jgi:transcriptional regulator with XRE-family HTH domain
MSGVLPAAGDRPVGALLRHWRVQRRLSQLELSGRADISTRHLSFVENGRATPSRQLLLRLAEQLQVPLRERNQLLLACGYSPEFAETALHTPPMAALRAAVSQVLAGHEPNPALAVDRYWEIVETNAGMALFLDGIPGQLLEPPANCLRVALHPDGLAPRIANLAQWRGRLLRRLRQQVRLTGDGRLAALERELTGYPGGEEPARGAATEQIVASLRLWHNGCLLSFISAVTVFGTPVDVVTGELAIESFFPADPATAQVLRTRAERAVAV